MNCHKTSQHQVAGSRYEFAASRTGKPQPQGKFDDNPASCQSCHGDKPHKESLLHAERLNTHTDKLACQTCHIPEYSRGSVGTEKSWDWLTATKMGPDGKPRFVKDSAGRRAFDSKKGNFAWDSYLKPEYRWFNGKVTFKTIGEKIDPGKTVEINRPEGSAKDPGARIWPFKVHRGKQAYDPENRNLLVVHTAGEDDTALWHNFDWPKAITTGMQTAGLPWSGKYDFVSTEMSWPIAHMVAPKGDAVPCAQCHQDEGRLKGIDGIYLPGRDRNQLLDMAGWTMSLLSAARRADSRRHTRLRSVPAQERMMTMSTTNRIYLYKRYERFWHWSQAALIVFMLITGFEIHGTYKNFGFQRAVELHTLTAWTLLVLWAFTIFWQFTTGEWRQYIPTFKKVGAMVHYYSFGIFTTPPTRSTRPREEAQPLAAPGLPGPAVDGFADHLGLGPVLSLLRLLEGLRPRPLARPGSRGAGPHGRRLHDADVLLRACLSDDDRAYALRPHQDHDHGLGRCRG